MSWLVYSDRLKSFLVRVPATGAIGWLAPFPQYATPFTLETARDLAAQFAADGADVLDDPDDRPAVAA